MQKTKVPGAGDAGDPGKASSGIEGLPLTKIASIGKAAAARHDQNVAKVLQLLAERWPRAFVVYQAKRVPLKRGIDQDIAAAVPGTFTSDELKFALRFYVGNIGYLLACHEGADRVDLDGNVTGAVTATEAARAARIVARRQRKAAKIAAKPAPITIAPKRISLADLRAAARARREAAT